MAEVFETAGKESLSQDPAFAKFASVLPSSGAIVDEIREEIPESVVSSYFGPKASKSGWKYAKHTSAEDAASILELWRRVYDDTHMPNKEISLQFARGLILQQTQPVNWAEFAVRRQRYREHLRESKTKSGSVKLEKSAGDILGGVQVLGKKRLQVGSPSSLPLPALKLTLKSEVDEECVMGKKVLGASRKGLPVVAAPRWVQTDLHSMSDVKERTERLLAECRVELADRLVEVERLEGQSRRAAIMLSDRVVMLEEHERELEKLAEQHTLLQRKIRERESLCSEDLASSHETDKMQTDECLLSRALAEKTAAHCRIVVSGCRGDLESVEGRLRESSERHKNVTSRVLGLERLLVGIRDQEKKMSEGTGIAFFPRPLSNNPEKPISTVHRINACPVCGYWYNAHNFVSLCCGHTYHSFCLGVHAASSLVCCFEKCEKEFSLETLCSIGIRVSRGSVNLGYSVKHEDANHCGKLQTLGTGPKLPSLQISGKPPLQDGTGTTTTSASTAQNSEPCSESSMRREENTIKGFSWHKSPQREQLCNLAGSDSSGARSRDGLAQMGFNQSQSSVSNDISGKEKAVHGGSGDLCTICKSKPAAFELTACGHDAFCFKCISGLEKCPVCTKDIAGWVRIPKKAIVRAEHVSPVPVPDEPEGPEESDDDESAGLVHWCDDDVFSRGGVRTVVGTDSNEKSGIEVTEAESPTEETRGEERPQDGSTSSPTRIEDSVPEPQKTFTRRASRTVPEELTPAIGDVETLSTKPRGTLSKKRGRKLVDVETLNHTRVMERPLTEILVEAPVYVEPVLKPKGKNVQPELTFAGKRLRTAATRSSGLRLTIPAKFRDL